MDDQIIHPTGCLMPPDPAAGRLGPLYACTAPGAPVRAGDLAHIERDGAEIVVAVDDLADGDTILGRVIGMICWADWSPPAD
jgi:hypothetical protein